MTPSPRRRALVIFNPAAGRRRRGFFRATLAALEARGCAITVRETSRPAEAEIFAREAQGGGWELVVAAGGDGTVNEVVNGLAGGQAPLGLLPLGTSNVLAREIGLRGSPREVARILVEGPVRSVHLGRANVRRFAVMASVGHDSRVVESVSLGLKRLFGRWAYIAEAVRLLVLRPPPTITLRLNGRTVLTSGAIVANGRLYGGSFVAASGARLEDPSFQVVLFPPGGRGQVLRLAAGLVSNRLSRMRGVQVEEAQELLIEGPAGEPVQGDGDLLTRLPATVSIEQVPSLLVGP